MSFRLSRFAPVAALVCVLALDARAALLVPMGGLPGGRPAGQPLFSERMATLKSWQTLRAFLRTDGASLPRAAELAALPNDAGRFAAGALPPYLWVSMTPGAFAQALEEGAQPAAEEAQRLLSKLQQRIDSGQAGTKDLQEALAALRGLAVIAPSVAAQSEEVARALGEQKSRRAAAVVAAGTADWTKAQPEGGAAAAAHELPRHVPYLELPEPVFPNTAFGFPVGLSKIDSEIMAGLAAAQNGYIVVVNPPGDAKEPSLDPSGFVGSVGTLAKIEVKKKRGLTLVSGVGLREARVVKTFAEDESAELEYPKVERDPILEELILGELASLSEQLRGRGGLFREISGLVRSDGPIDARADNMVDALPLSPHIKKFLLGALSVPVKLSQVREYLKRELKGREPKKEHVGAARLEEEEDGDPVLEVLERRFETVKDKMSPEAREAAERELARANEVPPFASEFGDAVDYLRALLELPWGTSSPEQTDLEDAQRVLDADHQGLQKVKERIIEFLAVRKALGSKKGLILAFDGPPGVGKTSLGRSIARALGRKFGRLSLGGVDDESYFRGHRRTYRGAMPGRVIELLRKLKVNNPLIQLDEIDKLGKGKESNSEAVLLELLDPEQNSSFMDQFLGVGFDLSNVLFIATANDIESLSPALRDRLDIVRLSGYTEREKLDIARRSLIRRQLEENGFEPDEVRFEESALTELIRGYTREAGVRQLERAIADVLRKIQTRLMKGAADATNGVEASHVAELLGPNSTPAPSTIVNGVGVASGLAWTPVGGVVLFIETRALPKGAGKGFSITGNLKETMTESAEISRQNAVAWALKQGVDSRVFTTHDFAIHVPEGGTPKDGPSAGVTMFTALASLYTGRAVRQGLAMTGELSLSGAVMPIGGLKEKALAALQLGYKELLVPEGNRKDYSELPAEVREQIKFHFVRTADEVAAIALEPSGAIMKPFAAKKKR